MTTIRLDDALMREAKIYAAQTNRTFADLVREGLISVMNRGPARDSVEEFKLPTFKGTGPFPGIDLNRTSEVLERLDFGDLRDDNL